MSESDESRIVAHVNKDDGLVCAKCYKPFTKELTDDEYSGGIPIPFAGWVQQQDKDDTEEMLRHQLQILQAENQRLKTKLRGYGENE
jgi:hypothetical protein